MLLKAQSNVFWASPTVPSKYLCYPNGLVLELRSTVKIFILYMFEHEETKELYTKRGTFLVRETPRVGKWVKHMWPWLLFGALTGKHSHWDICFWSYDNESTRRLEHWDSALDETNIPLSDSDIPFFFTGLCFTW